MKAVWIVSVIFLTACAQTSVQVENVALNSNQTSQNITSSEKESDTLPNFSAEIYKEYIPQKLDVFLSKEMSGWKIPAPDKWNKFWFNEYKTPSNLVNFISGDFNCDKQIDYALILADKQNEVSIWVFMTKKVGFEKIKLDNFGDSVEQIYFGLTLLEPGEINYIDTNNYNTKPKKINCQAIQAVWFEKAAEAYYWDKGGFKSIMTGD